MQCPICDDRMKEVERLGVSIDICPGCKGVWLDRGELDKLLELSRQVDGGGGPVATSFLPNGMGARPPERDYRGFGHGDHDKHGHDHDKHDREHDHDRQRFGGQHDRDDEHGDHRRRGSWLGELFGGHD